MKKKLRKELNKLLSDGLEAEKFLSVGLKTEKAYNLQLVHENKETGLKKFSLSFYARPTIKEPTKEELLEKAKRDYPVGTIFELRHIPGKYCTVKSHECYIFTFIDEPDLCINLLILENNSCEGGCVYDNGEWAKIIKKPVIKVEGKWLYEGDEYWYIDKKVWKLEKYIITKGYTFSESLDIIRFLTKQSALDFIMKDKWIPIEEKKLNTQQRVYVVCEVTNTKGGITRFQTMAEYIPYMTVKEEDYMQDDYHMEGDYNENEDEYYTPEGFYEWQSEPELYWRISSKITHWMPLIKLPVA